MRRNTFNEAHCATAEEVWQVLGEREPPISLDDVHAAGPINFEVDKASIEVFENDSGELALYIEAPTVVGVRSIIEELRLEVIE